MCALHCAQLLRTILHRTDLIIFPLTLQTIIIAWAHDNVSETVRVRSSYSGKLGSHMWPIQRFQNSVLWFTGSSAIAESCSCLRNCTKDNLWNLGTRICQLHFGGDLDPVFFFANASCTVTFGWHSLDGDFAKVWTLWVLPSSSTTSKVCCQKLMFVRRCVCMVHRVTRSGVGSSLLCWRRQQTCYTSVAKAGYAFTSVCWFVCHKTPFTRYNQTGCKRVDNRLYRVNGV